MRFPDKDDVITVVRVELEKLMIGHESTIELPISGARFDIRHLEWEANRIRVSLRGYVWTQNIQHEEQSTEVVCEFSAPADWWQHFKQRWFPAWALRRWPVALKKETQRKSVTHKFECRALFPDFKYEAPRDVGAYVLQTSIARKF